MLMFLPPVLLAFRYIRKKGVPAVLLGLVVLFFSAWTYQRNDIWKDPVSLGSDNVKKPVNIARPRINLETALAEKGKL